MLVIAGCKIRTHRVGGNGGEALQVKRSETSAKVLGTAKGYPNVLATSAHCRLLAEIRASERLERVGLAGQAKRIYTNKDYDKLCVSKPLILPDVLVATVNWNSPAWHCVTGSHVT